MLKFERPFTLKELHDAACEALSGTLAVLGAPGSAPALTLGGPDGAEALGLAAADEASPGALVFAVGPAFLQKALNAGASAFILTPDLAEAHPEVSALVTTEPRLVFAVLLERLCAPAASPPEGAAFFADQASVTKGEGATIGHGAYIGRGVVIGRGTVIGPLACIEDGVLIGEDCIIHPRAVLRRGTRLGDRCQIHCGAVIGDDGFGYTQLPDRATGRLIHYKNVHLGGTLIEDDVEIGANAAVDRGLVSDTVIGRGTKIDNLVQIGHNCRIGRDCIIVSQVGVGGHTVLEDRVFLLGQAGLGPGVHIGADAIITAQSGLGSGAVPAGRAAWSGTPLRPQKEHLEKEALGASQLPKIRKFFQLFKKAGSFNDLKKDFFQEDAKGKP